MNTDLMFSSKSNEWETPMDFFEILNREFNFNLDPCSTDENAKCERHFTVKDNGLEQEWGGFNSVLQSAIWQRNKSLGKEML